MRRASILCTFSAGLFLAPGSFAQDARVPATFSRYGTSAGHIFLGAFAQETSDGGYFAGGTEQYNSGAPEGALAIRLDASGNKLWAKRFLLTPSALSQGLAGGQTADGGYFIAGSGIVQPPFVMRLDSSGEVIWANVYAVPGTNRIQGIGETAVARQTSDGGFVLMAETLSFTSSGSLWILKLHSDGSIQWQKSYRTANSNYLSQLAPVFLAETPDGGYIATTSDGFPPKGFPAWVLKLNFAGDVIWSKTYSAGAGAISYSVRPAPNGYILDGGYGYLINNGAYTQTAGLILMLDPLGNILWQNSIQDTNPDCATYVRDLIPTLSGFIGFGNACEFFTGAFDLSGKLVSGTSYGSSSEILDFAAIDRSGGGGLIAAGTFNLLDLMVTRTNALGELVRCGSVQTPLEARPASSPTASVADAPFKVWNTHAEPVPQTVDAADIPFSLRNACLP